MCSVTLSGVSDWLSSQVHFISLRCSFIIHLSRMAFVTDDLKSCVYSRRRRVSQKNLDGLPVSFVIKGIVHLKSKHHVVPNLTVLCLTQIEKILITYLLSREWALVLSSHYGKHHESSSYDLFAIFHIF